MKRLLLVLTGSMLALLFGSAPAQASVMCSPYSVHGCETIRVAVEPEFCLRFPNSGSGGLPDRGGVGTGFTMVDPASSQLADQPNGHPLVPSYVADLLQIKGGALHVTATKGINFNRPGGVSGFNSLVNGLGVGFNAAGQMEIAVRLVNLDFFTTITNNQSQQAGIWFGLDEDRYVKLVVFKTDNNAGRVQLLSEFPNNQGGLTILDHKMNTDLADLNTTTLTLVMRIDQAAGTVTGGYRLGDDPTLTPVGATHTLPPAFFAGRPLPSGEVMSFAGVMATKRNAPEVERLVAVFDDFCINRTGNIAPRAQPDSYTTAEDTPLTVNAASGVLKNDTDPNADTMTAVLVTAPTRAATFTLNADGGFTYTPAQNVFGTDSFTYRASDGALTSTPVTVTITVTPVNDAPVVQNAAYSMDEDTTLRVHVAQGMMSKASDPDGDRLTLAVVTRPANGALAFNPSGSFTYTPRRNFFGTDTFTVRASDGALTSAPAAVTITVSPMPDALDAQDDQYTVIMNTPLVVGAALGVLANDDNPDGTPLTLSVAQPPTRGSLTLSNDGAFVYTPQADTLGEDSFVYSATTTGGSDSATVTLSIQPEPVQLITNGDFEAVSAGGKVPEGWIGKRLTNDGVRCELNVARKGNCAFEFRGGPGKSPMLEQQFTVSGISAGDRLVLSAYMRGRQVDPNSGRIVVRITYADGRHKNLALSVPRGTYAYRRYQRTLILNQAVTAVRVRALYNGTKGRVWVDDISLQFLRDAGAPLTLSQPASVHPVSTLRGSNQD